MPVAVPNYRLTTAQTLLKHPAHTEDLLSFLEFVLTWKGPFSSGRAAYDPGKLYVIGHSCSAHMLSSIYLKPTDSNINVTLIPSPQLLSSTRGLIFSEGLYDLDLTLRSFPGYKEWFIANTFGDRASYGEFNVAKYGLRKGGEKIRWLLLHSQDDTLVDQAQLDTMNEHLSELFGSELVSIDWSSIRGEHNDVLKSDVYYKIVTSFVRSDTL